MFVVIHFCLWTKERQLMRVDLLEEEKWKTRIKMSIDSISIGGERYIEWESGRVLINISNFSLIVFTCMVLDIQIGIKLDLFFVGTSSNWISKSTGNIQQWEWPCCWVHGNWRESSDRLWNSGSEKRKRSPCWCSWFFTPG